MKIALCTTTIHVPNALRLLRKCSEDVCFFVAADTKTPEKEVAELMCDIPRGTYGNDVYLTPYYQGNWKCSEAIGWNTLARRNIAFLEALKWGADVIYVWDMDNLPISPYHFVPFDGPWVYDGIKVTGVDGWFDPGTLLIPRTRHRGYPHDKRLSLHASHVVDAKVGVAAGLVIGDPDIDATTRMELAPSISQVHILGETGVVVDLNTWTVFNSQNTALVRELTPAFFQMPGVGRHTDIYASLIVQRVARDRGYHVHFGPPITYQERVSNGHLRDLRMEIDGMENVQNLTSLLDHIVLPGKSVIEDVMIIYQQFHCCAFIPQASADAGLAWLEDCREVLA